MKKLIAGITISTLIAVSSGAYALELMVVKNYDAASSAEIWKKAKTDQVPDELLGLENLDTPMSAYSGIFPKTFMQEPLFAVCHKSCNNDEIYDVRRNQIDSSDLKKWNVVEQSNVYFWLKRYFNFLEEKLHFMPSHYLKVITNREIHDETKGKVVKNNAFFNPKDISLSFLPATKNLLFKLARGKINRSGFDPSVVAHEASHYLFHHLFPHPINEEIGGLNEGFADYIANIFLNNPKVGLVMMHGKTMRDSSEQVDSSGKIKTYEPAMEVHDLGERVAYALWKSRELSSNKHEMDRLVIDAIGDLARDPYSTVHDFKIKMLERLPTVVDSNNMRSIRTIWEIAFPGNPNKIASLDFLNNRIPSKDYLGFKTVQILPEKLAKEYGTPFKEESNFTILQVTQINPTQIAILIATEDSKITTPYWIAIDGLRNNVLGIYGLDKNLITDPVELEAVKGLADKAKGAVAFIKDFTSKINTFTELTKGKGEFGLAYKVKKLKSETTEITFNGIPVAGHVIQMQLKRKLLTGFLFGLPQIESIDLFTLPFNELTSMPEINGERVVGYRLTLKTGTTMEVILNKFPLR